MTGDVDFDSLHFVDARFSSKADYLVKVRELNPEYDFHLVNDSRMDTFMKQFTMVPGVREAYFSINPAIIAAKADIWRYAVLMQVGLAVFQSTVGSICADPLGFVQIGGAYIDIDSTCTKPLREIIHDDDHGVVSWAGAWHRDTWKSYWDQVRLP